MRKEDYKMFTWHDKQILLHFVAKNHELTLTEGLVFSDNKLNQKNVDLLLDKLFPWYRCKKQIVYQNPL